MSYEKLYPYVYKKEEEKKAMKRIKDRFEGISNEKIISIDTETNGLWGKAFAIAGVVYENGKEVDRFIARCPIAEETNSWVAENVLPKMVDIEETRNSYPSMLYAFNQFLKKHKDGKVLTHMGHIVEANLFRDMHELGIIGDFEAPYEWYDVCLLFGDSVDSYNRIHGIMVEDVKGGTHNPLYDCVSAFKAFWHFINV